MGGVVEGVDVKREVARRGVERLDEQIDQEVAEPPEIGDRDGVLEPRERGLTGEVKVIGEPAGDELEDGIRAQGVVVVLILVIGEDAIDPLPHHGGERLSDEGGDAGVIERGGELIGEADLLVELPHGKESGIARDRGGRDFDLDGARREEIE